MTKFPAAAWLACAAALALGCSKNSAAARADSSAVQDGANAADATRSSDSVAGAAAVVPVPIADSIPARTDGMTGETRKSRKPSRSNPPASTGGKIIGRDSATMPMATMDSNGKITKIKR